MKLRKGKILPEVPLPPWAKRKLEPGEKHPKEGGKGQAVKRLKTGAGNASARARVRVANPRTNDDLNPVDAVFGNPKIMGNILSNLGDIAAVKECRLVCKTWEKSTTAYLLDKKEVVLNLQKFFPCCEQGLEIPTLFNPLLATRITTSDICLNLQQRPIFHGPFKTLVSSSTIFMAFCTKYHKEIEEIYFRSRRDQYAPLREVLERLKFSKLSKVVAEFDEAQEGDGPMDVLLPLTPKPTLKILELKRNRGTWPSGVHNLFEHLIIAAPNLERLVLGDYLYPTLRHQVQSLGYPKLKELVFDISPFRIQNGKTIEQTYFMPKKIKKLISKFSGSLEKLALVSAPPAKYGPHSGTHVQYHETPDPNKNLLPFLPKLKVLKVMHSEAFLLTPEDFAAEYLPNLEVLDISVTAGLTNTPPRLVVTPDFLKSISPGRKVHTVRLGGVDTIETIPLLKEKFPALKTLYVKMNEMKVEVGRRWSVKPLLHELGKLGVTSLHLEIRNEMNLQTALKEMEEVQIIYRKVNRNSQGYFLGLSSFIFSITPTNDGTFVDKDLRDFLDFVKKNSKAMTKMEFRNFKASIAKAGIIFENVKKYGLPIIFTDE